MLLRIDSDRISKNRIQQVVETLRMNGIIIYPTDTVYAMGCDLFNLDVIKKLIKLKKKEENKAEFSIICADLSMVSEYTMPIPTKWFRLMKRLVPGPYTFILKANPTLSKLFSFRRKTIGVRIPDNKIALAIVKELGRPLVTTSLKEESPDGYTEYRTDPEYIYQQYYRIVDLVIDGGFGTNEPSTVVDLTGEKPKIIRAGRGDISPILAML